MIIRIVGDVQWQAPDTEMNHLNRIDSRVEHAIETTSQSELTEALSELVTTVRTIGTPIADDNIVDSDLIVPDVSATIEEVSVWLSENPAGDGLIPCSAARLIGPVRCRRCAADTVDDATGRHTRPIHQDRTPGSPPGTVHHTFLEST